MLCRRSGSQKWSVVIVLICWGLIVDLALAQFPNAAHLWEADTDTDDDMEWEDLGSQADRPWALGGPVRVPTSSATRIQYAYQFDGIDDAATAAPENRTGDHSSSFELWFKPLSQRVGVSPIFEHGNEPRGLSFGLSKDELLLAFADTADAALISTDLDLGDDGFDETDFIQAVAVIDDAGNALRFYTNGVLRQEMPLSGQDDYTSNDDLGLGRNANRGGGGQSAATFPWDLPFHGQIGILREYRAVLSDQQVLDNYRAIAVPEPASFGAFLLGAAGLVLKRRILQSVLRHRGRSVEIGLDLGPDVFADATP